MENKFSALGVNEEIVRAITELEFETPTNVQEESIPKILDKKDLIVMSKTGSGKTGAFGIPILQSIESDEKFPKALILTPTRELAVQVEKDIVAMGKYSPIKSTAVYGQHNMNTEIKALQTGVNLVVGTPGRVYDHIKRRNFNTSQIEFLVLDEADRMLDMGFYDQVVQIVKALPRTRVTLLFSATMPPEIQRICKSYMKDPVTIELETDTMTVDTVRQIYYKVQRDEKRTQLDRILKFEQPDSCMIFCNTRIEVDRVQSFLHRKGYVAQALHGANAQNKRMKTIEAFKKGKIQIMVATDVAARGIHIDDLSLVINYDVPEDRNSYVHRVGRTGRAGNSGLAISIVTTETLMTLYEIEEHVGVLIDEEELPTDEQVAEALANADGKWVGVIPPKQEPKREQNNRRKDSHHKGGHKSNKDRERQKSHNKKTTTQTHKKATTHNKPKTSHDVKPKTSHDHKAKTPHDHKAKVQHHDKKTAPVKHHNSHPKKTKPAVKKQKKVVKNLGEIEFIVREEPKKLSFIERLAAKLKK